MVLGIRKVVCGKVGGGGGGGGHFLKCFTDHDPWPDRVQWYPLFYACV